MNLSEYYEQYIAIFRTANTTIKPEAVNIKEELERESAAVEDQMVVQTSGEIVEAKPGPSASARRKKKDVKLHSKVTSEGPRKMLIAINFWCRGGKCATQCMNCWADRKNEI